MRTTVLPSLVTFGFLSALAACGGQDPSSGGQTSQALSPTKAQPPSYDALDSAIVDAVLQRYSTPFPAASGKTLPTAIVCAGNVLDGFASQKLTTDSAGTEILLDQSDGDQVGGFLFSKSDLEALATKKSAKIAAKSYSGYWWSDGSHYSFANATCTLK